MSNLPPSSSAIDPFEMPEEFGTWDDLWEQLILFIVVIATYVSMVILGNRFYDKKIRLARKKDKQYWLQRLSARILGSPGDFSDKQVARNQPALYLVLNLVQYCLSTVVVGMWISKSYTLERPTRVEKFVGIACCAYFLLHGVLELFRNEFRISVAYKASTVADVLSCTSLAMALIHQDGWLSLAYFRVFNAHLSLDRIVRSTQFLTDFQAACLKTLSKFVTLMTISASTMLLVETLGDVYIFDEASLRTHNEKGKEISFFIMLYYSFVTISTVGYGDIYPESGLGRIVAIVMIFGGILFFTNETSKILELTKLMTSGKGSYKSKKNHVIVTGGALDAQNVRVFGPFVEELCHPSRGEERPQVLLVASQGLRPDVQKKYLKQWWALGFIRFLQGSLVRLEDMKRTSLSTAKMVFILGDVDAEDQGKEDERNLVTALVIKNVYPHIQMKVMMLKRDSKKLAKAMGIPPFVCYSSQNLEGLVLVNQCRAPGIAVILGNMIKQEPIIYSIDKDDHNYDYVEGLKLEVHGVLLQKPLLGLTYNQLAHALYKNWQIVLVGLMSKTGFYCSCDSKSPELTEANTIAYVLPRDKRDLDLVSRGSVSTEWDEEYNENLASILDKRRKMKRAANKLISKTEINFHQIPSFRVDQPIRARRGTVDIQLNDGIDDGQVLKNHIIILCHSDRQWGLVHVIARNIRQMQTTFRIKLLLLCPYEAPQEVRAKHKWVRFVVGDPHSMEDLTAKANVAHAARIIVLSQPHDTQANNQLMQDQTVVFVTSILEQEFRRVGRSVPLLLTFHEGGSHKLLPEPAKHPETYGNSYHLRSGQIVLVKDLLRTLACSYYTPGILDILLALLDRGESTQALWAFHPYRWVNRTFSELYLDGLREDTTCFALYRVPEVGNKHGNKIPFVWTLPPGDTVIKEDDIVYSMASKDYIMDNRRVDKIHTSALKIQRAVRRWLRERRMKGYNLSNGNADFAHRTTVFGSGSPGLGYSGYIMD